MHSLQLNWFEVVRVHIVQTILNNRLISRIIIYIMYYNNITDGQVTWGSRWRRLRRHRRWMFVCKCICKRGRLLLLRESFIIMYGKIIISIIYNWHVKRSFGDDDCYCRWFRWSLLSIIPAFIKADFSLNLWFIIFFRQAESLVKLEYTMIKKRIAIKW